MYALMAVGLTLVYGLLRILHIAHAAVFAFGAYVTVLVANASGSILMGFLAAIVLTPLCGIAIYRLLYQPLLAYRPDVPMIASIGLLVFMQDGFRILFGEQGVTFVKNPLAFESVDIAGHHTDLCATRGVDRHGVDLHRAASVHDSHAYRSAWRATVSNPRIAASFGVDAIRVRYLNFGIGSALAGIAGGLIALLNNFVDPTIGYVVSYKALAIIVLGGLGSVRGTLIASLFLALIESYGTIFVGSYLNRDAIAFLALIIILMARPQGFTGARTA